MQSAGAVLYQIANSMHFAWIALAGTLMLMVSLLLGGGDHEIDHDADHDHDADAGDGGNMSFLSFKVLWMFVVGFGTGGFFGARAGLNVMMASLCGIIMGLAMATIGYALMNYLYKRQGNNVVKTASVVGLNAVVDTPIAPGKPGEVYCSVGGQMAYFQAVAPTNHATIPPSTTVKVVAVNGSILEVELVK